MSPSNIEIAPSTIQGAINTTKIAAIEKDIEEIKRDLATVVTFVNETRGGHKYLWYILTLSSALGATISYIVTYITKSI